MRTIDADKLIEERFTIAPSEVYHDDEGELFVPLSAVIGAIRQAPTVELWGSEDGEACRGRAERVKKSIAEQLTHFLLCEDRQPEDVRVVVRYPGMMARIELMIKLDE